MVRSFVYMHVMCAATVFFGSMIVGGLLFSNMIVSK